MDRMEANPLPAETTEPRHSRQNGDEAMADDLTVAALGHVFVLMKIVNRILEDSLSRSSEAGRDLIRHALNFERWGEVLRGFSHAQRRIFSPAEGKPRGAVSD